MQLSIEDAKNNAAAIAKALNIKMAKVKQVQKYTEGMFDREAKVGMIKFTPPKVIYDGQNEYKTAFDRFQVAEVELEERITVVYEISN